MFDVDVKFIELIKCYFCVEGMIVIICDSHSKPFSNENFNNYLINKDSPMVSKNTVKREKVYFQ